jgi:hypothetical protein
MQTLHLTPTETELFQKLPAAVQEGWIIEPEKLTSYETDDMLRMRGEMAQISFRKYPELVALVEKSGQVKDLSDLQFPDVPEDVLQELIFVIGARGLDGFVRGMLSETKTDEDLKSVMFLSEMRHKILELNATDISSL